MDSAASWKEGSFWHHKKNKSYKHPNPKKADRDKEVKANQTRWSHDTYSFVVGDAKYQLNFYPIRRGDLGMEPTPKNFPEHADLVDLELRNPPKDVKDNDPGGAITGTGNAFKVFATAFDIMKKHMKRTGIPLVIGSKTEYPSRVKLYGRMFDKVAAAKWKTNRQAAYKDTHDPYTGSRLYDEIFWLLLPN